MQPMSGDYTIKKRVYHTSFIVIATNRCYAKPVISTYWRIFFIF